MCGRRSSHSVDCRMTDRRRLPWPNRIFRRQDMTIEAASIMTRKVVTVGPDDSVARVAAVLAEHEISAAPVCDKEGKLLGMLSEGDLMRPFGQENALRRAWWLGMLAEGTDLAPEFLDYLRVDRRR